MKKSTILSRPSPLSSDQWVEDISDRVDNWLRTVNAVGWYDSARFRLLGSQNYLEDWFDSRLGSTVVEYGPGGVVRWEGFVSRVSLTVAGSLLSRSLSDLANKVKVIYSTVDTSTDPPTSGVRAETGWSSDSDSTERWGTKEKILSVGGMKQPDAEELRDLFLEVHREPVVSRSAGVGTAGSENALDVECSGFFHTLEWLIYDSSTTGKANADVVIKAILTAVRAVNAFLSDDYSQIEANSSVSVKQYYKGQQTCSDILKSIVARGDGADPWIAGVVKDRVFRYRPAETEVGLLRELSDPGQRFFAVTGAVVGAWEVEPDMFLKTRDALAGRATPTDLALDPRVAYLDSVSFSMPDAVRWSGRGDKRLETFLAAHGLAGVGV